MNITCLPLAVDLNAILDYESSTGKLMWKTRSFTSKFANNWNAKYANKPAGVVNNAGYLLLTVNRKKYLAHRLIWKMTYDEEPGLIDHIDRNKLNNSLDNLRAASSSLNIFNKTFTARHLPRGVTKNGNQYMARISNKYLGSYQTVEEAENVYTAACMAQFGFTPPTAPFPDF